MFSGKVHDLRHFGLGHLAVSIDPALADAVMVNIKHNAGGGFADFLENFLAP